MKEAILVFSCLLYSLAGLSHERIVKGEKVSVGNGEAYSYVQYDAKNCPKAIGVALTKSALNALPEEDRTYILKLPKGVHLPPYKEINLNWNVHGHEPTGIYDIPHFDFHFYAVTETQRQSMCTGEDHVLCEKQPDADHIPAYYIPTPAGVPMMGWHWLDSRSPELHGERFTSTFIYGYYDAKIIFLEPMITREFMLAKGSVYQELPRPNKFFYKGYYPKKYVFKYDSESKLYKIVLKNLVKSY